MTLSPKRLLVLASVVVAAFSLALAVKAAIQTRVIVSVDHPNGTRLRVTQQFNHQPELFTTSIHFDDGDGRWRWYYFDHQDFYWGSADAEIAGDRILVTARDRRIDFDTSTGRCSVMHEGRRRDHEKSEEFVALPAGAGGVAGGR